MPRRTEPASARRVRRASLTARAAVLSIALAMVVLSLALPFKIWLGQRGQIADLRVQTRTQEQHVAALQHEQQQWKDPAYVEQQARQRLHYVMPGQTAYVVLGAPVGKKPAVKKAGVVPTLTGPWYSRLWQTVQSAGAVVPVKK